MMRKRKQNFTNYEKILILDLIEVHRDVVESKKNDSKTLQTKGKIWDNITETFNNNTRVRVHRYVTDLKDLYKRLKIEAKKQFTEYIRNLRATEGDDVKPPSPDKLSQKVYQIIPNEFEPHGIQSNDDNDTIITPLHSGGNHTEDISLKHQEDVTQAPDTSVSLEIPSTAKRAEEQTTNLIINNNSKAKRRSSDTSRDELAKIHAEEEHKIRMEYMREKKRAKLELLELKKQNELAKAELIATQIKALQDRTQFNP